MAAFNAVDVEHEKKHATSRDMAEKIVTQPYVAMRYFDPPRDVRDRGAAVAIEFNHAHDRMQGGERIRRDFRMGRGNFPEQRRFPRIGITNQRRVRHCAQLEKKMSLLAFLAFGVLKRGAIPRALEMHVALAATTALAQNKFLPVVGEIGDGRVVLIGGVSSIGPIGKNNRRSEE